MVDERDIEVAKELSALTQAVRSLESSIEDFKERELNCQKNIWGAIGNIETDVRDHDRHITKIWTIGGSVVALIGLLDVGMNAWKLVCK